MLITFSTNYELTDETLSAGSVDISFIPYGAEVLLTATRKGLSIESDNQKE